MADSSNNERPTSVTLPCPMCWSDITMSVKWETERGEFGAVLSMWPEVDSDPKTIDRHGHCQCDFSAPYGEVLASHINEGEYLENILFPPSAVDEFEENLDQMERSLLQRLAEADDEGIPLKTIRDWTTPVQSTNDDSIEEAVSTLVASTGLDPENCRSIVHRVLDGWTKE